MFNTTIFNISKKLLIVLSFPMFLYPMVRVPATATSAARAQASKLASYAPGYRSASTTNAVNVPQVTLSREQIQMLADDITQDLEQPRIQKIGSSSPGLLRPTRIALAQAKISIPEPFDVADAKRILEITSDNPTKDEIKKAFNKKAMQVHPDVGGTHQDFINLKKAGNILLGKKVSSASSQASSTDTTSDVDEEFKWPSPSEMSVEEAHEVLGVPKDASRMEIKYAYEKAQQDIYNDFSSPDRVLHDIYTAGRNYNRDKKEYAKNMQRVTDAATVLSKAYRKSWDKGEPVNVETRSQERRLTNTEAATFAMYQDSMQDFLNWLKEGVNINSQDKNGNTLLMNSIYVKNKKFFDYLLNAGADANKPDSWGNTVLHRAVRAGYRHHLQKLLDKGANPTISNNQGNTPLHILIEGSSPVWEEQDKDGVYKITQLLLSHGADINAINKEGKTALDIAYEKNMFSLAKALRTLGARAAIYTTKDRIERMKKFKKPAAYGAAAGVGLGTAYKYRDEINESLNRIADLNTEMVP